MISGLLNLRKILNDKQKCLNLTCLRAEQQGKAKTTTKQYRGGIGFHIHSSIQYLNYQSCFDSPINKDDGRKSATQMKIEMAVSVLFVDLAK